MNTSSNDAFRRSVDQFSTSQQSANHPLLLNAIKNKFANNENHHDSQPSTFSIPSLKLPSLSAESFLKNGQIPSKLNQFILGQLNESNRVSNNGAFAIPNLQIPNTINSTTPILADKLLLRDTASDKNVASLNEGLRGLKVCDDKKTPVIDLTIALNKSSTNINPSSSSSSIEPSPIDFHIPFIDCDIKENRAQQLPTRDEYCQADISKFVGNRYICAPSRFGRITCLKYKSPKRILCIDHSFYYKHKITRFNFDTKSPDDIVLASLRKYNKV